MELEVFIKELELAINKKGLVVFTGAGLSTASGIKDFRGKKGLFKENIQAEEILSHHFMIENPEKFYTFYRENLINKDIKPNLMHEVIAYLQEKNIVLGIITQNIDGLDTLAGSKDVVELHGNANRFYCMDCKKKYTLNNIMSMDLVPRCECGGLIRPDVVLYEEPLKLVDMWSAKSKIAYANNLLVLGSSLKVNPASSLVHDFIILKNKNANRKLFIVNEGKTDYDYFADFKYDGDIIDVAKKLNLTKKN